MMKKLLIAALMMVASQANAQLNNSWIDYSKPYHKFFISQDSLCRIPQSTLAAAGLGSVNADHFQLWRNGVQVRLYTSVSNAILGPSDYIEFWGEMNDGKPDMELYRNPDYQLNDRHSLETDTAAYFMTVNTAGNNLRYLQSANTAPSTATPDAYFMRSIDSFYHRVQNRGYANQVGEYVYSSSYDAGEGWTTGDASSCCALFQLFTGLNVYRSGPQNSLTLRAYAAGNAPNPRSFVIKFYGNPIDSVPMPYFDYTKMVRTNLPISLLPNNGGNLLISANGNNLPIPTDRVVIARLGITYPATFNFNNQKQFYFELAPSATGNYLVIDNFNYGTVAPLLYDMTEGRRYVGEILSTPGKVKFVLPPSTAATRSFRLLAAESANINPVPTIGAAKIFTNFGVAANQSDYVIVSNPLLYNDGSGNNYVEEYRAYRGSAAGGGYNAKIVNIDELTDQFAFGIKNHPASVRDFVRYATQNFTIKPKYLFIVGRGMNYRENWEHRADPMKDRLNLVTTFGWPASDVLLVSEPGTTYPLVPIGRLGAISGTEVNNYLKKVREYELAQKSTSPYIADRAWMKNILHVAGGKDSTENVTFKDYMNAYGNIAKDTLFGAHIETFSKSSTGAVQQASGQRIEQLINEGLGMIGYFGHSSANFFEFNLSSPEVYNNAGKYPFFNVSGCSAGNFFNFDPLRLTAPQSLSEKYVLANQRGSIGFLADTHFGIPPFLNFYNLNFYTLFGKTMYGNTVGNQVKEIIKNMGGLNPTLDYYTRIHLEEVALHGDPAIRINAFSKADYAIEDPLVRINPSIISVAEANFSVDVKMQNIGKATGDSIWVSVKRKLPNDSIRILFNKKIPGIRNADSLQLIVPINPNTDKGLNKIIVDLDYTNLVDELYETNNSITKEFYIFEDELRPSVPYNFSIVNQQNITYVANTANPLGANREYRMEIDTTELFNSAFKKVYATTGMGGVVQFTPTNITFTDSTVYYWRVSIVPINNTAVIWNASSFIYLPNSGTGFNQSHYFQQQKSTYDNMRLDADRVTRYLKTPRNLIIRTGLYPFYNYDKINVNLDFDPIEIYGCTYSSLQVYVFDTATLKPWRNRAVSPTEGLYGSSKVCPNGGDGTRAFFEFPYANTGGVPYRKNAMDFIDLIPNGMFVAITNLSNTFSSTTFIDQWKADTLTYGPGNSLYHKLKSIGFSQIDSLTRNLPFLYFYKKGSTNFTPVQVMGASDTSYIDEAINLLTINPNATVESPAYGPAKKWNELHWRGFSTDPVTTSDTTKVEVWGVKNDGTQALVATVAPARDTTLDFVDAKLYPYLKLKMHTKDDVYITPYQLKYWRINASLVPEGAVAPNVLFNMTDTVSQGQNATFELAFKNISQTAFDSLLRVKIIITDRNNVPHEIEIPKRKALVSGDTLTVKYSFDTRNYPGNNTLFIDFNPDNDQAEQHHYNNIMYKDFYVRADDFNPLLDVTFDGVHILNTDLVSSKPNILVKLKDESAFLALKDTSLIKVQVRFPDLSLHDYHFGDTMIFIPANLSSGENTASIEFKPYFPEDGEYELIVSGKDMNGNKAGELDFRVTFNVINKPMISNLLNYPNPFTTSTAFVFEVTGSEVPQNIRIQVLTITGKVVREITKNELGPIHIGRNITEFKWDGTDMYGQKLANGVYIYRVLTNLNGKSLDKYRSDGNNTDKYFNKGYGKMYLMR
jgi:hypothetical protein